MPLTKSDDSTAATPPLRRCGRCRLYFPAERGLHPAVMKEWWSCPACSAAIIPSHRAETGIDGEGQESP